MSLPILNEQAVEKQVLREDGLLEVHSIFRTIQGEGPWAGTPAAFVRLAGCNLQCEGCDTDYTSRRRLMDWVAIFTEINRLDCGGGISLIVLTGGEPFRQRIGPFVREVISCGFGIQIETNGTLHQEEFPYNAYRQEVLSIVCSPKTPKIHPKLEPWIHAWKYIIHADHIDPDDGLPTSSLLTGVRPARSTGWFDNRHIFVQPFDGGTEDDNKRHRDAAVQTCLKHGYRLSLQQHKILGLE